MIPTNGTVDIKFAVADVDGIESLYWAIQKLPHSAWPSVMQRLPANQKQALRKYILSQKFHKQQQEKKQLQRQGFACNDSRCSSSNDFVNFSNEAQHSDVQSPKIHSIGAGLPSDTIFAAIRSSLPCIPVPISGSGRTPNSGKFGGDFESDQKRRGHIERAQLVEEGAIKFKCSFGSRNGNDRNKEDFVTFEHLIQSQVESMTSKGPYHTSNRLAVAASALGPWVSKTCFVAGDVAAADEGSMCTARILTVRVYLHIWAVLLLHELRVTVITQACRICTACYSCYCFCICSPDIKTLKKSVVGNDSQRFCGAVQRRMTNGSVWRSFLERRGRRMLVGPRMYTELFIPPKLVVRDFRKFPGECMRFARACQAHRHMRSATYGTPSWLQNTSSADSTGSTVNCSSVKTQKNDGDAVFKGESRAETSGALSSHVYFNEPRQFFRNKSKIESKIKGYDIDILGNQRVDLPPCAPRGTAKDVQTIMDGGDLVMSTSVESTSASLVSGKAVMAGDLNLQELKSKCVPTDRYESRLLLLSILTARMSPKAYRQFSSARADLKKMHSATNQFSAAVSAVLSDSYIQDKFVIGLSDGNSNKGTDTTGRCGSPGNGSFGIPSSVSELFCFLCQEQVHCCVELAIRLDALNRKLQLQQKEQRTAARGDSIEKTNVETAVYTEKYHPKFICRRATNGALNCPEFPQVVNTNESREGLVDDTWLLPSAVGLVSSSSSLLVSLPSIFEICKHMDQIPSSKRSSLQFDVGTRESNKNEHLDAEGDNAKEVLTKNCAESHGFAAGDANINPLGRLHCAAYECSAQLLLFVWLLPILSVQGGELVGGLFRSLAVATERGDLLVANSHFEADEQFEYQWASLVASAVEALSAETCDAVTQSEFTGMKRNQAHEDGAPAYKRSKTKRSCADHRINSSVPGSSAGAELTNDTAACGKSVNGKICFGAVADVPNDCEDDDGGEIANALENGKEGETSHGLLLPNVNLCGLFLIARLKEKWKLSNGRADLSTLDAEVYSEWQEVRKGDMTHRSLLMQLQQHLTQIHEGMAAAAKFHALLISLREVCPAINSLQSHQKPLSLPQLLKKQQQLRQQQSQLAMQLKFNT